MFYYISRFLADSSYIAFILMIGFAKMSRGTSDLIITIFSDTIEQYESSHAITTYELNEVKTH